MGLTIYTRLTLFYLYLKEKIKIVNSKSKTGVFDKNLILTLIMLCPHECVSWSWKSLGVTTHGIMVMVLVLVRLPYTLHYSFEGLHTCFDKLLPCLQKCPCRCFDIHPPLLITSIMRHFHSSRKKHQLVLCCHNGFLLNKRKS